MKEMSNTRPNLVYIFADQWRRQAVGFMKEDPVLTPNMDKFSEESLVFDNCISCFPLCSPHRASLLTGKYPLSTGMFTNCKIGCDARLKEEEICIGDVIKAAGYDTAYIGKWHLDLPEVNLTDNPVSGARNWDAYTEPGPKRHGFDYWYSYGTFDEHLTPHYWKDTPEMIKVNQWSVEHETDMAINYMKNHDKDKPFTLFLSWNPPHSPYDQVPEKYKRLYEEREIPLRENFSLEKLVVGVGDPFEGDYAKALENTLNYYAAVSGIDENFGRVLEELKKLELEENTIVVLSSDHGDMMVSHGLTSKNIWYEEAIGVPFMVRMPNKIKGGRTDALFASPDIMPTLLGFMGLDIPSTVEGIDLSGILTGEKAEEQSSVYICSCPGSKPLLEKYKKLGYIPEQYGWRGVRTKRFTYVVNKGYIPEENKFERYLYDNEKDPYQKSPIMISNTYDNIVAKELEGELKGWLEKLKDPFTI